MHGILFDETHIRKCSLCGEEKPHAIRTRTRQPLPACIACIAALPPAPEGKRRCPRCLMIYEGKKSYCKDCSNVKRRARHTLEDGRAWSLLYHYNITPEEYDLMLFQQGGVCAICKQPETVFDKRVGRIRSLAVDHDHENGNVRGLLCARCNHMLGKIETYEDWFKDLFKYKKKHNR